MQTWKRLGHLYSADGSQPWLQKYASNPVAQRTFEGKYKIYFSSRDAANRSSIGVLEVDLFSKTRSISVQQVPLVGPGETGAFDDSGVSNGSVLEVDGSIRLYYLGWNLGLTVPFTNFIGLATAHSGSDKFSRFSQVPLVDRSAVDPLSLSYPFVMRDGAVYRMWYGSMRSWGSGRSTEEMDHVVKTAVSTDGINWTRSDKICLEPESEELGICRPSVIKDGDIYRMWYCYRRRNGPYTIGYSESPDGGTWQRLDQTIKFVGPVGDWEHEMICYPSVFRHDDRLYMLYCGNHYGRDGFGWAVLE